MLTTNSGDRRRELAPPRFGSFLCGAASFLVPQVPFVCVNIHASAFSFVTSP
jgi:hypothetical protein